MTIWTAEDGTEINFSVYGSERHDNTLLLLPGLLGALTTQWRNFIRPLSADFRVVTMDLRGHGRSQNNANDLNPEQMMQDIGGLLDFLQIESVHIAGYNFGGYLGLMLALNQPRRVSTLLMHATKFYWIKESAAKLQAQLNPDSIAEKVPAYADQLVQAHGARRWRILVRQAADLTMQLFANGLTDRMISHTQCPVLVSVGDRDKMVPLAEAQRLSRMIPQGKLIVLPDVSHPYRTIPAIPLLPMMRHFHISAHRT
ncbi:MAG: alpha/beta hydrolase [Chloroflexi bacterium]|nr:alpha/beta hydrolase [Chloroflexota bacterium]